MYLLNFQIFLVRVYYFRRLTEWNHTPYLLQNNEYNTTATQRPITFVGAISGNGATQRQIFVHIKSTTQKYSYENNFPL